MPRRRDLTFATYSPRLVRRRGPHLHLQQSKDMKPLEFLNRAFVGEHLF